MTAYVQGQLFSSQQVGVPECVEDYIHELAPWETPLLSIVGLNSLMKPCTNVTYIYQDMEHRPTVTTLNGAISATTTTTFVLTDTICKTGELIQVETELILLGATSDNLTFTGCTRGMGSTTAATYSSGQQVGVLGKLNVQGTASGSSDHHIMPSQVTNYTTIIKREILPSGTANALPRYGRNEATEYDADATYQLGVSFKELEKRFIWGYSQAASTGATAGGMNGIWQRINSSCSTDLSAGNVDLADFRSVCRTINKYGAPNEELLVLAPLYQKDVIDSWGQPYINHNVAPAEAVTQMLGTEVNYLFVGGRRHLVVPYAEVETETFVLSPSKLGIGPLQGRAMFHEKLAKDGDRFPGHIIGEYTCEVPCIHAHHVFYNGKYS